MPSASAGRPIGRAHSATDLVSSGSFASPLAQLSLQGGSSFAASRAYNGDSDAPPVPPLDLNLFRTSSVYSVDSIDSLSTISNDEVAFNTDPESPSTPRATMQVPGEDYFSQQQAETERREETSTPKRSFVVRSRQAASPTRPSTQAPSHQPYLARSPVRAPLQLHRDVNEAHHREEAIRPDDLESLHGEQGSDWGDDEENFEWLDGNDVPQAMNGDGRAGLSISPSKRLGGKLKAAVSSAGDGKKLRKPLVFPRRAAPPPPKDTESAPPPSANANSPLFSGEAPSSARSGIVFPARGRPAQQRWQDGSVGPDEIPPHHAQHHHPIPMYQHQPRSSRSSPSLPHVPTLVPMRDADGPSSSSMDRLGTQNAHLSMQSAAYSFYDLDSPGPSSPMTPSAYSPQMTDSFAKGRYTRVPVSRLDSARSESRERQTSDPTRSPELDGASPDILVAKGIEARGLGDLPKSAWLFMKAADAGSSTGRMYWGLALRHGWGVAKDDKKAFAELRQACDESLAEGGIDFHRSPGAIKLSLQQRKAMTRDLSLGMFEIANCFLEGVGAKKAPDIALSYLRFAGNLGDIAAQEQLGFLLSKGGSGVKKDMKEAAKWYRMAIGQGSTNTFGLAWVWKEKYM